MFENLIAVRWMGKSTMTPNDKSKNNQPLPGFELWTFEAASKNAHYYAMPLPFEESFKI